MIILAILAAAASEPPLNADDAYAAYEVCVKKQVFQLIGAGESAEATAKAAMNACDSEHIQAELLLHQAAKYPGTAESVLTMLDDRTHNDAVLQVMRARSKKNARYK